MSQLWHQQFLKCLLQKQLRIDLLFQKCLVKNCCQDTSRLTGLGGELFVQYETKPQQQCFLSSLRKRYIATFHGRSRFWSGWEQLNFENWLPKKKIQVVQTNVRSIIGSIDSISHFSHADCVVSHLFPRQWRHSPEANHLRNQTCFSLRNWPGWISSTPHQHQSIGQKQEMQRFCWKQRSHDFQIKRLHTRFIWNTILSLKYSQLFALQKRHHFWFHTLIHNSFVNPINFVERISFTKTSRKRFIVWHFVECAIHI